MKTRFSPWLILAGILLLAMVARPQDVAGVPAGCQFAGLQFYGSYWCHAKPQVNYEQASTSQIICSNDGAFVGQTVTCEGDITCPSNTPSCSVRVSPFTTGTFLGTDGGTGELIYYYASGSEKSRSLFTIDFATGQYYQVSADSLKESEKLYVKIKRNFGTTLLNSPKVSMALSASYVPYELIIQAYGMNDIVGNANGCSIAGSTYEKDICASGCPNNLVNQKIVPYGQFANFPIAIVVTDASTLPIHPVYGRGSCNPVTKTFIPYNQKINTASGCYIVPSGVSGKPDTVSKVDVSCCPGQVIGSLTCDNDFVLKPSSDVKTTCSALTGLAQCLGGGDAFTDTSDQSFMTKRQATGCDASGNCIYKTWKVECTYDAQCGGAPAFCNVATNKCETPGPRPYDCRTQGGCEAPSVCDMLTGTCKTPAASGGIDWLLIAIVGGTLILGYSVLGDKKKGRK